MAIQKAKLEKTVERVATLIEEHLGTLPPSQAKAMLTDIRKLAMKSSRSANRRLAKA